MKKSMISLLLAGIMALSGCSALLEREYVEVVPYEPVSSSNADSSTLRAQSYQELVNAVMHLVSEGEERGVINLYNYTAQDAERDLSRACLEVVQEDPLGAYAVDYIRYESSLIVSYFEVTVNITYRRTLEQMDSIISVTGSNALRQELQNALTSFSSGATLKVSYFTADEKYIHELAEDAYFSTPTSALGKPEVTVSIYPDTGYQRIVEIELLWPESTETLRRHSEDLKELAANLITEKISAEKLYSMIRTNLTVTTEGENSTPYDALFGKKADSMGLALAYQILCDQAGLKCHLVHGQLDGTTHYWNIISEDDGETWRHMDLSTELLSLTDEELVETGAYRWDNEKYPSCLAPELPPDDENIENNPE